jgi:hypothetical protein
MNTIKRPPTVWLTQSLLILFAVLFSSLFLFDLVNLLRNPGKGYSVINTVIAYSIMLGMEVLLLSAFLGLAKRKMYGRWLGLLSLTLVWILIIFVQLRRPAGQYKYYEYNNSAQLAGAAIFQACLHGLFLVLILRLSFARKVGEFFRKEIDQDE